METKEAFPCEQLALLDNSQAMIRTIFLGLGLQYKALDLQRDQLLAAACDNTNALSCCPDPKAMQLSGSMIILYALLGFQKQAEGIVAKTREAGLCPDMTDVQLNAIIIVIALIRLSKLAAPQPPAQNAAEAQAEELEELELEADPLF